MNLAAIQSFMAEQKLDAWVVYDFRGNSGVFALLVPGKKFTTRRIYLVIPAQGKPTLIVHGLDSNQFVGGPIACDVYTSWTELGPKLRNALSGCSRVAMEYSPGCALPVMSIADAGTVEMVRSLGYEVVSSADLVQASVARWGEKARKEHDRASAIVDRVKDEAFAFIGEHIRGGKTIHEHEAADFIRKGFTAGGLEFPDGPIVAVNAHAGDPHYEPSEKHPMQIKKGDWVLIDLWARVPGDENVYSDITWTGYVGKDVPAEMRRVYDLVNAGRDASLKAAQDGWKSGRRVQGWELDEAARKVFIDAGMGQYVKHRTGHSLSPGPKVHGLGFNLDNLETRDTRVMLADLGFTIEPGLYLPTFGVRSEINVHVDPKAGPVVTSKIQREPVLIG